MNKNNILEFQQLSQTIRQQIHQNYFFGRKPLNYHDKSFYRYMSQEQSQDENDEFMQKEFNLTCLAVDSVEKKAEFQFRLKFSLRNKDNYYLIGSLEYLKYLNEQKEEKKLKVCDAYNQFLSSFHFEIRLPQVIDDLQITKLKENFSNPYPAFRFKKKIIEQNENYICLKDISEQNFSTYQFLIYAVPIQNISYFALELDSQITYFFVKSYKDKDKPIWLNKNGEQELTFVVGVEDQQTINKNLFQFILLDEHDKNQIDEYKNTKAILQEYEDNLKKLTNSIRIKISSFHFDIIVHHNTLNQYALKQGSDSNYEGIIDKMDYQIEIYEIILQQLSFENGQWKFKNEQKELKFQNNKPIEQKFYKMVDRYESFYLKTQETALISCPSTNIKFSFNPVLEKKNKDQQ
ncbi:unnamed protein product [Paramecium octaurelia]|uniref:Uncharacterized protein n=1 Tax=Paramecium octaurelia TaxID=43137 RepID=A0A8S1WI30_PAROT|nr:unnamed protein product [Paramecium octaurelia]